MAELRESPRLSALYPKAFLASFTKRGGELPSRVYERFAVEVDPAHLADYSRVCGFRVADELPVTYPHVLTYPMQFKLMTDNDFPFPLMGSVHVANRITQLRPLGIGEKLDLRVHVDNLRPHAKGTQFDMISEVSVAGDPVWHDTSTYLRRGPGTGSSGDARPDLPEPTAYWRVPGDTGRRYAEVSGDYNPIHLHPLSARLFGFRRAIAHGMWTKARCLAAFEGLLPDAFTVDVRFKLPVSLPAKLGFRSAETDDGWRFDLTDAHATKPHLAGTIS
ncbi:MaoC/PaaZ C-terminal domain-containing protein [Actinokineospora inagensis]|uniref:MaoC/PaaZ C-terminal domain-containing protein n=1 Tax=Actinokineospora inagensis TaxID=103730 RepID=UPI0005516359|nr:MaoC/PaaZ C-terminal domain-containing protein [Actinokineospora inagensis]